MKTKVLLPVLAVIAALAIVFVTSSFLANPGKESKNTTKPQFDNYYFEYTGTNDEEEYKKEENWSYIGDEEPANPCGGTEYVCILVTNEIANPTREALVDYLEGLGSAAEYCNDPAHSVFEQDE